ncbi:MAG TPA: prepilin-type N-terminal cleavage/methylation domain-containing protein [Verrucomicrobiae bacterium]|nr:prepilin-type N-terminal cleavage/methylation domain-containing protein [Verrucomicrobiae bacterium]
MNAFRRQSGFTLIELLTVIGIIAILAALVVPAIKNVGNANSSVSATRQLLDDVARARQLAIANHTTVYMVFVPTNFWTISGSFPNNWWNNLTLAQQTAATNLVDKQLSGYTFMANGAVGDQPGRHQWHYLAAWQNLPEGSFIATNKFAVPGAVVSSTASPFFNQWDQDYPHSDNNAIYAFTNTPVPFPTVDATNLPLPYIAFNYLGQLTTADLTPQPLTRDEYIPLTRGTVGYGRDPQTKMLQLTTVTINDIVENPPGNSTNSYNIVHIDALTGRATLEYPRMK